MQVTVPVVKTINVFLDDPQTDRYGLELMRETGLQSGTLYPILARLERAGWLTSAKEQVDPHAVRRPPRRYYRLTANGIVEARFAKAEFYAQLRVPGPIWPGALSPEGRTA